MFIIVCMVLLCLSSIAVARGIWIEGKVTKTPWKVNSNYQIKVNKISYEIMPDARITYRYERNKGAYNEEKAGINSIRIQQSIMIKAYKNKIIQIILF